MSFSKPILSGAVLLISIWFFGQTLIAANTVVLRGSITDPSEAMVPAATITLRSARGSQVQQKSNDAGYYEFRDLAPGTYQLKVEKSGFSPYQVPSLLLEKNIVLNIKMQVAEQKQEVNVESETQGVSIDQTQNAGALILREKDLESLSDDPDEMAAQLQALAGPGAGPNGAQIFIDGFEGSTLPPKSSIREIRINRNPYSSEYDRIGFGRIEILTKPGADKLRFESSLGFSDNALNSRNPLSDEKGQYQSRQFGAHISGPLLAKKASYSIGVEGRSMAESSLVNATVLNSQFQAVPYNQTVDTPQWRFNMDGRLDYQLNDKNTLIVRYGYSPSHSDNGGVGGFSLPSMASNSTSTEHSVQVTETNIINAHTVNETRFQYRYSKSHQTAANSDMITSVADAFTTGGSSSGNSYSRTNYYELQNSTSYVYKKHNFKLGGRLRFSQQQDYSPNNFNGTYFFAGRIAPELDSNYQEALDANGQPVLVQISSLEAYRRTLVLASMGYSAAQIRALGGGASQFTISGGNPLADVSQVDWALYGNWDWLIRPNLTLSAGLRWEGQNNISDHKDFSPRAGLAWALDAKNRKPAKTVLRWGAGLFYDRISSNLTLSTIRFNGINQFSYRITNPDDYPNIPSSAELIADKQNIYRIADGIESPYTFQTSLGIERQLPLNSMVAVNYLFSRGVHLLRMRDLNIPGANGERPDSTVGSIYQYESSGLSRQQQVIVNFSTRYKQTVTLYGFYSYGRAYSDTDGANSLPSNPDDLHQDWGPSNFDIRHRVVAGGSIKVKWNVSFSPFIQASSGSPFNITTGMDNNGDGVYNDRPAFATAADTSNVVDTAWGNFLLTPTSSSTIISRNYGRGPGSFTMNLRVGKSWQLGKIMPANNFPDGPPPGDMPPSGGGGGAMPPGGGGGGPGGPGGPGGGPGGGGPPPGGGSPGGESRSAIKYRYNLTLSLQVSNLLNTVNLGSPVGNLGSPYFGQSTTLAGGFGNSTANNRRVELQLRFSF